MKNVNAIATTLTVTEMAKPYIKAIAPAAILTHFANQPLVILTKRLYNSNKSLLSVNMTGAEIVNLCKTLETKAKLTADVSGVIVTSKPKNMPTATATMGGETVIMNNVVVTPAVSDDDDDTPPWETKAEVKPVAKRGIKPMSFFCKIAIEQAKDSDFEWCLSAAQMNCVKDTVKERFHMDDAAIKDLTMKFLDRFTKRYGRSVLLTPELLAWKYKEAHFFITTGGGVFNYVVRKTNDGGDIFPANDNFEICGKARHYKDSWEGEMDPTMKRFFSLDVLLKEVVR